MISISNIDVSYGSKKVLKNIDLQLNESNVYGIVGLNGSGKTTLLNTIYGIKKADAGNILIDDKKLSKQDIAYIESENYFYPYLKGKEYLNLINNKDFDNDLWQKLFNIPLNELIDNYSTGMKKKLAILFGIKMNKNIYIFDEPFNGLDVESTQILKLIITKMKKSEKTLIVTSHIIEVLPDICDYIFHIDNGEIKNKYSISDFDKMKQQIYVTIENNVNDLINKAIQ
ncbi:MAG: ATP-binding cassette domain-containing protein [Prevotellaceae bacterium]|jgi:ABC-2 type transport system ATP-binding protein|nr:ATP-binding cassette domain-containing protein [Prevotellaceae bacterium]